MQSRRSFLKATVAASATAWGHGVFADEKPEALRYWDNHAGYGYAGPQDVALLDHWRSAGTNYLSINVGYDPVPWIRPSVRSRTTPRASRAAAP